MAFRTFEKVFRWLLGYGVIYTCSKSKSKAVGLSREPASGSIIHSFTHLGSRLLRGTCRHSESAAPGGKHISSCSYCSLLCRSQKFIYYQFVSDILIAEHIISCAILKITETPQHRAERSCRMVVTSRSTSLPSRHLHTLVH